MPGPAPAPVVAEPASWPEAIEIERIVPASGNMTIGPQQFWLGTSRTGQTISFWIDTTTVHLSIAGWRIKTVPSRLSAADLARLRQNGARMAGPPPAGNAPGALAATSCVEVQRLVNAAGIITLGGQVIQVGSPLAGQRARIRLDGQVMHVITQDGILWRTVPCPIPPGQRHRLQGVRLAGPDPLPQPRLAVQRRVSSRGGIQVARQRIQAGLSHAGQTVTIELGSTSLRIIDQHGELITTRMHTRSGRLPLVLWIRPTQVGERALVWCRAGICAEDFEAHTGEIAAACYAREARIERSGRWAQLVTVDIVRRDTLAAAHIVASGLVPEAGPATFKGMP